MVAYKGGKVMLISPLGDLVLIEKEKPKDKYGNGMYIPEQFQVMPQRGRVLATGSKVEHIKIFDSVIYVQHAGNDVLFKGRQCVILQESKVLAIITE